MSLSRRFFMSFAALALAAAMLAGPALAEPFKVATYFFLPDWKPILVVRARSRDIFERYGAHSDPNIHPDSERQPCPAPTKSRTVPPSSDLH